MKYETYKQMNGKVKVHLGNIIIDKSNLGKIKVDEKGIHGANNVFIPWILVDGLTTKRG